jgi:hypothetical protein
MNSLSEMVTVLTGNPDVLGLIEYGSACHEAGLPRGDYDLIVVLKTKDPELDSLHFRLGDIPVDLNLWTLAEIRALDRARGFTEVLLLGGIIHDPTGEVQEAVRELARKDRQVPPEEMSPQTIAFVRHGTRHVFDKIRSRQDSAPTLCKYLLHLNMYWLVQHYFDLRQLAFRGEKRALEHLRQHEPSIHDSLERFYASTDLGEMTALCWAVAEAVLEPVGGMWRDDEVLVFGDREQGLATFQRLFGEVRP